MGRFKDYKLLAAVLGILVTAGPVLWFSAWLQKQGEAEVSVAASWTVGNVDVQIGRAVAVLDALADARRRRLRRRCRSSCCAAACSRPGR